jgi:hypothetical protein
MFNAVSSSKTNKEAAGHIQDVPIERKNPGQLQESCGNSMVAET